MNKKYLRMSWLDEFKCIGGECPSTCCCSTWKIALTDKEIERYENLDHPFRSQLLDVVDKENKCMKGHSDRAECAMLTSDGWCKLVMECGEEYLSNVCKIFPRNIKEYGDITEGTVKISCPIVAKQLFNREHVEFCFGEDNKDIIIQDIDYEVYDSMAMARAWLIELLQMYDGHFIMGKLYTTLSVMFSIREMINQNKLKSKEVENKLNFYQSQEVLALLFKNGEEIANEYDKKTLVIQNFLNVVKETIMVFADTCFVKDNYKLHECIEEWCVNADILKEDIIGFTQYFRASYRQLFENYFVYSLFCDWIDLDTEKFGNGIVLRCLEYTMIQLYACAWWKCYGRIDVEDYALICTAMDRGFFHNSRRYNALEDKAYDNIAVLLELCIC